MDYQKLIFDLNEIGIALSSETNLNRLLDLIIEKIIVFTNCDGASLFLREEDPDRLVFKVTKTISLNNKYQYLKEIPIKLEFDSIAGYTVLTGKTVNIKNCYQLDKSEVPYHFNPFYDQENNYQTISLLSVPMFNHNREVIGVIQLVNNFDEEGNIIPFSHEVEKIINSLASQAAVSITNAKLMKQKQNLYDALVEAFVEAIEKRSPHTAGHSKRVAYIAIKLAQEINRSKKKELKKLHFSLDELKELKYAALLHDVGKVGVPEEILDKENKLPRGRIELIRERFEIASYYFLIQGNKKLVNSLKDDYAFLEEKNKPGFLTKEERERIKEIAKIKYQEVNGAWRKLLTKEDLYCLLDFVKGNFTPNEWEKMQMHVTNTYEILKSVPFRGELKNVLKYASTHHEMLNGSGYPNHLTEEDLVFQSRILAIADMFEALTASDRPYKKAIPFEKALEILQWEAQDNKIDPDLIELLINSDFAGEYIEDRDNDRINYKLKQLLGQI